MPTRVHQCSSTARRFFLLTFVLAAAVLLVCWDRANAHIVIFKDGFTLKGTIKEEKEILAEGGFVGIANRLGGFRMVDDGARRMYFSHKQVQEVLDKDLEEGKGELHLGWDYRRLDRGSALPAGRYDGFTPWNAKWDRTARIQSPNRKTPWQIAQHLTTLTPHYAYIQARLWNWSPRYLTTEFDVETVRSLLSTHPNMKLKGDKDDAPRRFIRYRFLVEAGFYEAALAELDGIATDMPEQKEKVEKNRAELRKQLTVQLLELVELSQKVGRHDWAQARMASFPQKELDENQLVRLRALQSSYEAVNTNLKLARGFLETLPPALAESGPRDVFADAAGTIASELNPDTIGRLETFIAYAQQADADKQKQRTPANTPEQLLSLAVSGWLLGNAAAESKVDTAVRLWNTRQFVLKYQRSNDVRDRKRLLAAYEKGPALPFDELDQLIRTLPPADPYQSGAAQVLASVPSSGNSFLAALVAASKAVPGGRLELTANLPWSIRKGPNYLLQLPLDYHAGRAYPVLFVLHEGGEGPEDMLARWSSLAAQNGYFLVAPEWERDRQEGYRYTQEEQRAVVEVMRDLRQHFQIDSDRVFVTGLGEGGNMAFDVGLSHPDLFAGIIPMGGRPQFFAEKYWPNAQNLPFYVIDGDLDGPGAKGNRQQFQHWIGNHYPAIFIQYKGRGSEWFGGELPYIFDWMNRKKRATAFPDLGRHGLDSSSEDYRSMRPSDNQFYWLAGAELSDRFTNDSRTWKNSTGAAMLQARIRDNDIYIYARGFKRVTVWLGQGMLDYDKPSKIFLNQGMFRGARKIAPSLETLLEDFYQRGDRQRHFFAKVELPL